MKKSAIGVAIILLLSILPCSEFGLQPHYPCAAAFLPRKVHKAHRGDPGGVSC